MNIPDNAYQARERAGRSPEKLLVDRHEAARMLSLSVPEVDNLRRAGKLLARKHGRKVLIPVTELRRFAESLPFEADLG